MLSVGVYPTTRLLRWWWDRRGRNSCCRSLLLRWHVDEDDEDLARVHAGSGSHNLDAPLPGAPKMSGKLIHQHLWGPGPFRFGGGGGRAKSGSRQYTRAVLPSFGPHGCVKPYYCLLDCIESLLRSDGRCQTERGSVSGVSNEPNLLYVVLGPPFIR